MIAKTIIILGIQLLLSSHLFGYVLTHHETDDGQIYSFTGYCSNGNGVFVGGYTPNIPSAHVSGPNGFINGKYKDDVIRKVCNKKQTHSSLSYGYAKKNAFVFEKRTGKGSIEHALTPEKDFNRMDSVMRDALLGNGEYKVIILNSRVKIKIMKKYYHKLSGKTYYKIKDRSLFFYILKKDLSL